MFFILLDGPKAHEPSVEKHFHEGSAELQIPPLRYASVGMTILLGTDKRTNAIKFQRDLRFLFRASDAYGFSLVKTWSLEMSLNMTNAAKISRTTKAA